MYLPYKEKEIQLSQLSYMTQSLDTPTWMIENRLILDRNDLYWENTWNLDQNNLLQHHNGEDEDSVTSAIFFPQFTFGPVLR